MLLSRSIKGLILSIDQLYQGISGFKMCLRNTGPTKVSQGLDERFC